MVLSVVLIGRYYHTTKSLGGQQSFAFFVVSGMSLALCVLVPLAHQNTGIKDNQAK